MQPRYFKIHDAALRANVDVEVFRQWAVWFDGEPERVPLYFYLDSSIRVLWSPIELTERALETGLTNQLERRAGLKGQELWDVTNGHPGIFLSEERSIGPGLWLEISPDRATSIASAPEEAVTVHYLRAPSDYSFAGIPACASIFVIDPPAVKFGDCWVSAEDVSRISESESTERKEELEFPPQLQAAINAYRAVRGSRAAEARRSPKAALIEWLEQNTNLGSDARERVAVVANWKPQGGAPKSVA